MKWSIAFSTEKRLLLVKTFGVYSVDSGRQMIDDILSQQNWQPNMNCIFDHRGLDFSPEDPKPCLSMQSLSYLCHSKIGSGKIAIVMKCPLGYSPGFSHGPITKSDAQGKVAVFAELKPAMEWSCK